jgi:hypothetical protein
MTDSETDPTADCKRLRGDTGDLSPRPLDRPAGVAVGGFATAPPFGPAAGTLTREAAPGSALTTVGTSDSLQPQ